MANDFGFEPMQEGEYYFISYNSEDKERVAEICRVLNVDGVPLWYDSGLHYGEKWETEIAQRIAGCKAVLMFFSKGILQKQNSYVQIEYDIAEMLQKKVYIVFIDEVRPADIPLDKAVWYVKIMQKQTISVQPDIDGYCRQIYKATDFARVKNPKGLEYTLTSDGNGYAVSIGTCTDTDIVVPAEHEGKPVTEVAEDGFATRRYIKTVTLPDSVTKIDYCAFEDCECLEQVTMNGVRTIGCSAFKGCGALTGAIFCELLEKIEADAFCGCCSLQALQIPSGVYDIGPGAFSLCGAVEAIEVNEKNRYYASINNCLIRKDGKTLEKGCKACVIPDDGSVTTIGDYAFDSCKGLTEITVPYGITGIGDRAFEYCKDLTEVNLPGSIAYIGEFAFNSCSSLSKAVISDGITEIGNGMFWCCSLLTEVILPESVTAIDDFAFTTCTALTEINIPASVTLIGDCAFANCANMCTLKYYGTKEQWKKVSIGEAAFDGVPATHVICLDGEAEINKA